MKGVQTSVCPYQCDELIEPIDVNPDCLDPVSLEYERMGEVPFFISLFGFALASILIFICLSYKIQVKGRRPNITEQLLAASEDRRGDTSELDFSLKDCHAWCHYYRLYLKGKNTPSSPWVIPTYFPKKCLTTYDKDKLLKLLPEMNQALQYSWTQRQVLSIASWICPLAYPHLLGMFQRSKFELVQQKLYRNYPQKFWADEGSNRTLRLSSKDCSTAYVDFLDFSKKKGSLRNSPAAKQDIKVKLLGDGGFSRPFFLDFVEDPLCKSIALWDNLHAHLLLPVFDNLNSLLSALNFGKLEPELRSDLDRIITLVKTANKGVFLPAGFKATLYLIETNKTKQPSAVSTKAACKALSLDSKAQDQYDLLLPYLRIHKHLDKTEFGMVLQVKKVKVRLPMLPASNPPREESKLDYSMECEDFLHESKKPLLPSINRS
mmetsp:Transcript_13587/g.21222  ORF Transcript_13587/g.21222 Transcript_13587/m.21222 type:complete len:434 (+) Transcript_13587:2517-3818(+)